MWTAANAIDAYTHTAGAIAKALENYRDEMQRFSDTVAALDQQSHATYIEPARVA